MVSSSLLPFEHEALFVPSIVWPSMEVIVLSLTPRPVVKATKQCALCLRVELLKNCLRIDAPVIDALQKGKTAAVIGMQAANQIH